MAYVISSEAGKKKANEMTAGEKWTASDGSTWEKKSDGSVSVTTSKGEKFDNAYTPTSNSPTITSGGGTTYKPTGNSQYTKPTLGSTWDANTDYQAIINAAVENGDYVTAAKAEQLRNQKIISTGSNYDRTSQYGGYMDGTGIDWGTVGTNQVNNGASWEDVLSTYYTRYGKAMSIDGLGDFAKDDIQNMMWQYVVDQQQKENQPEKWSYDVSKPTTPERDPRIDSLLTEILNREDFSYNAENDPLYQQYAKTYRREGDRAMRDTLSEAAAGAGGMNTYAITAAQQANNNYIAQLNDKIPELYQLAYEMYLNDKESKVQDLGILMNMDESQYNRYRDTINDYYKDKDFAYGVYRDDVQDGQWQTQFDYNSMVDNRNFISNESWAQKEFDNNNYWAQKEFDNNNYWAEKEFDNNNYWAELDYNTDRGDVAYDRAEKEKASARDLVTWYVENGSTSISPELLAQAGMNQADVDNLIAQIQAGKAKKGSSSGSSPRVGSDPIDNLSGLTDEEICKEIYESDGKTGVQNYLKDAVALGEMTTATALRIYGSYMGK